MEWLWLFYHSLGWTCSAYLQDDHAHGGFKFCCGLGKGKDLKGQLRGLAVQYKYFLRYNSLRYILYGSVHLHCAAQPITLMQGLHPTVVLSVTTMLCSCILSLKQHHGQCT